MPRLSIRIDFDQEGRLGPGKVALLERIAREGSISAAGRSMNMSYKRAWELVAEINESFTEPLVCAKTGGKTGCGAVLTPRGVSTAPPPVLPPVCAATRGSVKLWLISATSSQARL